MKILIAIAPEKFRDEELTEPVAALQKAGIGHEIASNRKGTCTGMLGARVPVTLTFEEVDPEHYEGLVIIGGSGSQAHLWNDSMLIQLVKYFYTSGKLVAAICLAPVVLANAGILKGKQVTFFASPASTYEISRRGAITVNQPVVRDGWIITANGPAAAREFGEAIVYALTSRGW